MRETDLGWLAGIIDGEGTMGVYTMSQKPRREGNKTRLTHIVNLSVSNTDARIVGRVKELCSEILGRNPMVTIQQHKVGRGNSPKYQVMFGSQKDVLAVLSAVEPYLIGKRDQAGIMIELLRRRVLGSRWSEEDQAVIAALKQLKRPWSLIRSQAGGTPPEGSQTTGGVESP